MQLTQALMMTTNVREAASMVSGSVAVNSTSDVKNQMIDAGAGYFSKNDYVADLLKLCQLRKDTE